MVKRIIKVGEYCAVILETALLESAHLKAGDEVNVEIHAGGTITLTPLRPNASRERIAKTIKAEQTFGSR